MDGLRDVAQWIPFVASVVPPPRQREERRSPGGPQPPDMRPMAVRVAEIAIIVGVMWLQIEELEDQIDGLRRDVSTLQAEIREDRARNEALRRLTL